MGRTLREWVAVLSILLGALSLLWMASHPQQGGKNGGKESPFIDEAAVSHFVENWATDMMSTNPEKVAGLYAPAATLLPTFRDGVLSKPSERLAYFTGLCQPGLRVELTEVTSLGGEVGTATGLYTFFPKDKPSVKARFVFVVRFNGEKWLIYSHHSSVEPEAPST